MSNQGPMSPGEVAPWLRRLRIVVVAYVALILLFGLVYIAAKLIGAEFGSLLIGVVATLSALALGALAWGGLWLAGNMLEQRADFERERERIDLVESALQAVEVELEQHDHDADRAENPLTRAQADDIHVVRLSPAPSASEYSGSTVAAPAPSATPAVEERLRAAIEAGDMRAARDLWPALDGGVPASRRNELRNRLDALTDRVAGRLRDEFAALVRREDYRAALRKGDEIAALLPESRMCRDFESLRPHLEARAADAGAHPSSSGDTAV